MDQGIQLVRLNEYEERNIEINNNLNNFSEQLTQTSQQTAQQITQLQNEKATLTEVQRLELEKAAKTEVNTLATSKVDKIAGKGLSTNDYTTSEKELVARIPDTARLTDVANIASGTPLFASSIGGMTNTSRLYVNTTDGYIYVYSNGAWSNTGRLYQSTGIEDGSVTSAKRTKIGTLAAYTCHTPPYYININTVDKRFEVPENLNIVYNKQRYTVPASINVPFSGTANLQGLYFDTATNTFTAHTTDTIPSLAESKIMVMLINVAVKNSVMSIGTYAVDGVDKVDIYQQQLDHDRLDNRPKYTHFTSSTNVNFNFNTGQIVITSPFYAFIGNKVYGVGTSQTITFPLSASFCFLYLDTSDNSFALKTSDNNFTATKTMALLATLNVSRKLVSANGTYSVNGIQPVNIHSQYLPTTRLSYKGKECMYMSYANDKVDFNFTTRKITIPQDLNILIGNTKYVTTSKIIVDIPSGVSFVTVYFNVETLTFTVRTNANLTSGTDSEVLFAMLHANSLTTPVITNGSYSINGSIPKLYSDFIGGFDDTVKVSAHRGYDFGTPENTKHAFIRAKENGFAYIEFDVRYTSDGKAVILHDETINRTGRNADGTTIVTAIKIQDITYAQALIYDFGIWKGAEFNGTKILTLEEALRLCKLLNVKPCIHVSAVPTLNQINELFVLIKKLGLKGQVAHVANGATRATEILNKDSKATVYVSYYEATYASINEIIALKTSYPNANILLDTAASVLNNDVVNYMHENDIDMNCYAPNESLVMTAINAGAVGLTVDNTNVLRVMRSNI